MTLTVTPWNQSSGVCECCGNTSKTVWGDVTEHGSTTAIYYVQWTIDSPDHLPNVDLIVGPWGDGTAAEQRVLISLLFHPSADGGSFMVVDGAGRPADDRALCGRALSRIEVIGQPPADKAFEMVDAIWAQDPRIEEVRALNDEA